MRLQTLWFAIGAVAGFVVAREASRRKRWGTEFRQKPTSLHSYREAINASLGRLFIADRIDITGGYADYGGQGFPILGYTPAAGTMRVEV